MNTKKRRRLRWVLRGVVALLGFAVLLGVAGALYQSRASAADRARFTPPGEMVDVNGRQMHLHCQGEGSPTVILDAGQGGWSVAWTDLMPQLSDITRVCAYDRAGYGWSDPADDERTPQAITDDLVALLDAANLEGPYVIVGFSYTGLSSRLFAAQNPEDVVGMVLVDPATEFDNALMDESLGNQQRATVGIFQAFGLAARLGLVRFLDPREMAPYAPFIPENAAQPDIYYSFVSEPQWWRTSQKEFVARLSDETLTHVRDNGEIRDIPLVIIGAETIDGDNEGFEVFQAAHLNRLRDLAGRSSQGDFILAENSTHEVPRDRPDVVIEAVERVVTASRD